jgi:hypothetical protein
MKEDVISGISFMMNMVIVCLSITIGLLLSKVLLHDGVFGATKMLKHQRSRHFYEEFDSKRQDEGEQGSVTGNEHEEDEQMAI